MNEKSLTVLEQYDLETSGTYRIKGNYGWETKNGRVILQEYNHSNEKMQTMNLLYQYLEQQGFITDSVISNKAGLFVSISQDGYAYILKKWYDGEDCSITDEKQLLLGAKTLGRFHKCCKNTTEIWTEDTGLHGGINILEAWMRHNKEIIHIRNYIKLRKNKNYFETSIQKIIDDYYNQGVEAYNELLQSQYNKLFKDALTEKTINHCSYNYHNIMFQKDNIIVTNWLKASYAPAIQDLYDYLRKILEKNNWNKEIGKKVLYEYETENLLCEIERKILKVMFSYPEKFWKIINYYYNSNKGWYSTKNEEKLKQFQEQEELRWNFIKEL